MARRGFVEAGRACIWDSCKPRLAHYIIKGRREQAWTRHGESIPEGEQLYVIWKSGRFDRDEYQGGYGYAGHLPTDKESAEWYAEQATARIRAMYWWQQDAVFNAVPYKPEELC